MPYAHLFQPYDRGDLHTRHRIALAPLTRNRAVGTVPADINAEYYAQRADAAFVITEGTHPAAIGQGYYDVAGLHSDEQQDGWAKVASAVRAAGDGKLVIQLMHAGRVAHPAFTGGATPVAPSAVRADGTVWTPDGQRPYVEPRALATDELPGLRDEFVRSARRAIDAGAYGVELHAANGYLLNQFLADSTNQRDDGYGGDVAGRIRFVVETFEAVAAEIGVRRTGIRLSPGHGVNDLAETDPRATYEALLAALASHDLLYVHVLDTSPYVDFAPVHRAREIFPGTLVANPGFSEEWDFDGADRLIADGTVDFVAFGRSFLANPDLPTRLRDGRELNEPDPSTFYSRGPKGYTDYPTLAAAAAAG